jgi:S1-C subfamily serine protease
VPNTLAYSIAGSGSALGFAIPVDVAKSVVPDLIRNGLIPTPGIGIVPGDEALALRRGIKGVIIARIRPGSPADRASLRAMNTATETIGDVITAANGETVSNVFDLTNQLDRVGIGHTIKLTINRDGKAVDVDVEITDIGRSS